ncbi:MAG: hypothetical protein AB9882_13285 [Ignavibacteriaceae bacterium]
MNLNFVTNIISLLVLGSLAIYAVLIYPDISFYEVFLGLAVSLTNFVIGRDDKSNDLF